MILLAFCRYRYHTSLFDRPGFNRLIADATAGRINLVLCKDLSRLGRDYIGAGRYTDVVFPSLGCRFIALNDGVDTIHQNNEMLVILKNVMNDLYARDTSNKIRAVKQSTFRAGKYVGCYAPIGYQKSPADKHVLEIDPVTAPVVQRIFDLRCQGNSYRKIALTLNDAGVPTPSSFYYMKQGKPNPRPDGDFWASQTVKAILRNEVYLGHMVQNKTGHVSYKVHKQIQKPESEWIRVKNTHPPLITQEAWDIVRKMDEQNVKYRSDKVGNTALFAGILFCAGCGTAMRHYRDSRKKKDGTPSSYQSYACGRYASGGKAVCSAHSINQRKLTELVLCDIRRKAALARDSRSALKAAIMAQKDAANLAQAKTLQATLTALETRLAELDRLVVAAYEDKVKGEMPELLCIQLLNRYEAERRDKQEQRLGLTAQLAAHSEDEQATDAWLDLIRDCVQLEALDRPTLLRLIKRIEVGEKYESDGERRQDIKILYNSVGHIEL